MTKIFTIDVIALPLLIIPIELIMMLLLTLQLYNRTKRKTDLYTAITIGIAMIPAIQSFRWANGIELIFWSSPFQWTTLAVLLATAGSLYFSKGITIRHLSTFLLAIVMNIISFSLSPTLAATVAAVTLLGIGVQLLVSVHNNQLEDAVLPYLFLISGGFVLIGHWVPYNGGRFLFGISLAILVGYEMTRFFSHVVMLLQTASFNSLTDGLTGLYNKSFLFRKADQLAQSGEIGVIFADIDDFKKLNDTRGHEAGDDVLRQTGNLLKEVVRSNGYACRFGGEELVAVIHTGDALELAKRFCQLVNKQTCVTVSIGVSFGSHDGSTVIRSADEFMYEAKRTGKNRVVSSVSKD